MVLSVDGEGIPRSKLVQLKLSHALEESDVANRAEGPFEKGHAIGSSS
jgi:hypothetical protein